MQTTFANGLSPSFYGKQIRSGVPAYDNNGGIRTVGGLIAASNTNPALFGCALFGTTADPDAFLVGGATGVFRGILMNRAYVNEQLPGHADRLLNGQPADAIYHGAVWVTLANATGAVVGATVYAFADGTLTCNSAATGAVAIPAKVKSIDTENKLYLIMVED